MHINLERNSQIFDFVKLKWVLPCLFFTLLLPDWKDNKGKETPCELVGTHTYGLTDFLDQHWKCLQKRPLILMYFRCNIYRERETSVSTLEKKCCLIWKRTHSFEWNAMRKVCKLVQKRKKLLNTSKFSQEADKHQHQDLIFLGGEEEGAIYDVWGRSVLCDPRTLYHSMFGCNFATLAILDICVCNMCLTKANKKSLRIVR